LAFREELLSEVPGFSDWIEITPITKGWSMESKFRVTNSSGQNFLVRLSDFAEYETKKVQYEDISKLSIQDVRFSQPVAFGLTKSKKCVYTIFNWIDGKDALDVIPMLSKAEQYKLGQIAGRTLRKIHEIPAPPDLEPWFRKFRKKFYFRLKLYIDNPIKFDENEHLLKYLTENLNLLRSRPQTLQHGDFHLGNMVICTDNKNQSESQLGLIDFNRLSYGDPWEEFERSIFTAQVSPDFINGQIHAYFNDNVPELFFPIMAVYISYSIIASISWAEPFGSEEIEKMLELGNSVIRSYDGFRSVIPDWYEQPKTLD